MKTKILFLSIVTSFFASQSQAQSSTRVNAMSDEISDNLDLRAVADIFGDSRDLQDFERRLNDPKLQISNLDLNDDDEVDYLRVIETVEKNTHVIIVQSVLDRDVYQDVATIEVEKDRNNRIQIQIVGNEYMYGSNYIYEPVYYSTPAIYASFWSYNYRPYVSNWYWNYYPSYYYAWNPYPVYRYRSNINISLNINNHYNYVNYRRSNRATILYSSRRSNAYERQRPDYHFSRRNNNIANRYELDQRRTTRYSNTRNNVDYSSRNRTYSNREVASRRTENQRDYSQNRVNSSKENMSRRTGAQRDYSQNRVNTSRESAPQRATNHRDYSQNRTNSSREATPQRAETQKTYSQNRVNTSREAAPKRAENQRSYSQNRVNTSREVSPKRAETQRNYSQDRATPSRQSTPQRAESRRGNPSGENNRRS